MYAQAGYEPGLAADYVEPLACRTKWTTRARDDIEKFIEDELLRATDDEIAGVVMPEGTAYVSAAVRAQKILLEQRLVHWVHRTNRQQGVAPTTSMVLDVAEEHRMADPGHMCCCHTEQRMKAVHGCGHAAGDGAGADASGFSPPASR